MPNRPSAPRSAAPDPAAATIGTWRQWALALLVCTIGLVAALIVLIAVTQADVLASTALVIAILAFLIQIVIFVSQFWISIEQARQLAVSHGETATMIARSNAEVASMIREMVDASRQNKEAGASESTVSTGLRSRRSGATRPPRAPATAPDSISALDFVVEYGLPADAGLAIIAGLPPRTTDPVEVRTLLTWPDTIEAVRTAFALIAPLSPRATNALSRYARDEVTSRRLSVAPGFYADDGTPSPASDELLQHGLVTEDPAPTAEAPTRTIAYLTELGRSAARFVYLGEGPPEILWNALQTME